MNNDDDEANMVGEKFIDGLDYDGLPLEGRRITTTTITTTTTTTTPATTTTTTIT